MEDSPQQQSVISQPQRQIVIFQPQSALPIFQDASNSDGPNAFIFNTLLIFATVVGLRKFVRKSPELSDLAKTTSHMSKIKGRIAREENTVIPNRIQSKYNIVGANAAAANQATTNGRMPDIPPEVGLKKPDENVLKN